MQLDMDPYERAFRHVGTHLLMDGFDQEAVWKALEEGRAFVGFDWICDTTGFVFQAELGEKSFQIGSKIPFEPGIALSAHAPIESANYKLIRDGKEVHQATGRSLSFPVTEPGIYRVEVWLSVGDEEKPWILSNPIYLRKP